MNLLVLIATVVGAAATVVSVGVALWPLIIKRGKRPVIDEGASELPPRPSSARDALPIWVEMEANVAVQLERLPDEVRGRGDDLDWLQRQVRVGGLVVLVGTGGMGKSTVARELVRRMPVAVYGETQPPAWEVSGSAPRRDDPYPSHLGHGGHRHRDGGRGSANLNVGLTSVARQLGATTADLLAIAIPTPAGPERLWNFLKGGPKGWLLIIDDADDPQVLAAPSRPSAERTPTVNDGNGWVRPSRRGLVLVTSRQRDPLFWPPWAILREVKKLSDTEAAAILRDLAPEAGDQAEAEALAQRLGGLPLILHLVGLYLSAAFVEDVDDASFEAYRRVLDSDLIKAYEYLAPDPDDPEAINERAIVTLTWELSLDVLAKRGLPGARPLLRLLSCYGPALPIPLGLLKAELVGPFLNTSADLSTYPGEPGRVDQVLRGLDRLGLIEQTQLFSTHAEDASRSPQDRLGVLGRTGVVVHPVIADTNRLYLLHREPSHLLVRQTAVNLLATVLDSLTADRAADWPAFRVLTPHLQALLASSAGMLDDDHLDTLIRVTGQTAMAYGQMGTSASGIELITSALVHAARHGEHPTPTILILRQKLAMLFGRGDRDDEAEKIYRVVLKAQLRYWAIDDPANLAIRHNLAESVGAQGPSRWNEADAAFRDLLEDERRVLGEDHPITLATRRERATLLCRQERWAEAEEAFKDLLKNERRVLGADTHASLITRFNLAQAVRHQKGRRGEAETAFRDLLEDERRVLGKEHVITMATRQSDEKMFFRKSLLSTPALREDVARTLLHRGLALSKLERHAESAAVFEELADRFGGDPAPVFRELVASALLSLAGHRSSHGDWEPALQAIEQATGLYQELAAANPGMFDTDLTAARQLLARIKDRQ